MLLGEHLVAFHRPAAEDAGVCELCLEHADALGWVRDGSPTVPLQWRASRRRGLRGLLGTRRERPGSAPYGAEEIPEDPRDAVEAGLELFNESSHRRTVSGIARTLGDPHVSVVRRSTREVVVTVAWDLSWYQYRVDMLGAQPVTLQHRGEELDELDERFRDWNAQAERDGTVALAG